MDEKKQEGMSKMAYELVAGIEGKNKKEFRSLARSFPSMLQVNGLGASVAFLYSKGAGKSEAPKQAPAKADGTGEADANASKAKNAHEILYSGIAEWIRSRFDRAEAEKPDGNGKEQAEKGLMEQITELDSGGYRLYMNEVMNLSLWIKRFAEGMLGEDSSGRPKSGGRG